MLELKVAKVASNNIPMVILILVFVSWFSRTVLNRTDSQFSRVNYWVTLQLKKTVETCLTEHLSNNNLLNPFQSAYTKGHSTETTLLSVHDHIIKAMSLQQVTCLTLLDLSAAFATIDHSILLERLSSWF